MTKVAVFMGSASDEDLMKPCAEVLAKLGRTLNRALTRSRQLSLDGRPVTT